MIGVLSVCARLGRWLQGGAPLASGEPSSPVAHFGQAIEVYSQLCLGSPDYRRLAFGLFVSQMSRWVMTLALFIAVVRSTGGLLGLLLLMFGRIIPGLPIFGASSTKAIARFSLKWVALGSLGVAIVLPWVFVLLDLLSSVIGVWPYVMLVALNRVLDAVFREYTGNAVAGLRRSVFADMESAALAVKLDGVLAGLARVLGAGAAVGIGLTFAGRVGGLAPQVPYMLASLGSGAYAFLVWRVGVQGSGSETARQPRECKSLWREYRDNWRYSNSFPGLMPMVWSLMITSGSVWAFGELFSKAAAAYPKNPAAGLALVGAWMLAGGVGQFLAGHFVPATPVRFAWVILLTIPLSLLVLWQQHPLLIGVSFGVCYYLVFAADNRLNILIQNHRDWAGGPAPEERGLLVARITSVKQMMYELSQAVLAVPTILRDRVPSPFDMSPGETKLMWMSAWAVLGLVVVSTYLYGRWNVLRRVKFA